MKKTRIRFRLTGSQAGTTVIFANLVSALDISGQLQEQGFVERPHSGYHRHFEAKTERGTKVSISIVRNTDKNVYFIMLSLEGNGSEEIMFELETVLDDFNLRQYEIGFSKEEATMMSISFTTLYNIDSPEIIYT